MEEHDKEYNTSISEAVDEINKKKQAGEEVHPLTEEGLKAVEFANNIVNSIMRRNRPDLAYFKLYMNSTNSRVNLMTDKAQKETAPQKQSRKSLRRKRSNRVNNSNDTT